MSQTYIFTVCVTGEDVQDQAVALNEAIIELVIARDDGNDYHVTESVRVTPMPGG